MRDMGYGEIGATRPDRAPPHWRKDYRLKPKAKQLLAHIETERKELHRAHTAISEDMSLSDEEYNSASREISAKLDALIDRMDMIRRVNPA